MVEICLSSQPDAKTKAATETKTIELCVVSVFPLRSTVRWIQFGALRLQNGPTRLVWRAIRCCSFFHLVDLAPTYHDGRAAHIKSRSSVSNRQEFDWVAVRLFPVAQRKSSCRARCIKTAVGLASGGSNTHVWCMFARPTHHHRWHKINRRVRFVPAT
jgi:hypothetical protein